MLLASMEHAAQRCCSSKEPVPGLITPAAWKATTLSPATLSHTPHRPAVIPYYGYARADRKVLGRESIAAKLTANLLTEAGADRVLAMDLHSGQCVGYFDIPVDHVYGERLRGEECCCGCWAVRRCSVGAG
jgi:hypothetical protein